MADEDETSDVGNEEELTTSSGQSGRIVGRSRVAFSLDSVLGGRPFQLEVITLAAYAAGKFLRTTQDRLAKVVARTRADDRLKENIESWNGARSYILVDVEVPQFTQWPPEEEKGLKGYWQRFLNHWRGNSEKPDSVSGPVWACKLKPGQVGPLDPKGKEIPPEKVQAIYDEARELEGKLTEKLKSALVEELKKRQDEDPSADKEASNIVDRFSKQLFEIGEVMAKLVKPDIATEIEKFAVLTPEQDKALPQKPRGVAHMLPKWQLIYELARQLRRKITHPNELVRWPYKGCQPQPGCAGDKQFKRAIRTGSKTLPEGLFKVDGQYMVERRFIDIRGVKLNAHYAVWLKNRTAKQVYENLQRTISMCQKLGPNSPHYLEWPAPTRQHGESEEAFIERYQRWIDKYEDWSEVHYDRWYPSEQYDTWDYIQALIASDGTDLGKAEATQRVVGLDVHIINKPRVTIEVRTQVKPDQDKDTKEKVQRIIGYELELVVDWSEFDYFTWGDEGKRDKLRIIKHRQMTKQNLNTRDSFDEKDSDAKRLRGLDYGGIWNPTDRERDWGWLLTYLLAADPRKHLNRAAGLDWNYIFGFYTWPDPMPPEPGPDANQRVVMQYQESREQVYDQRIGIMGLAWSRTQPGERMPHDGTLMSHLVDKWAGWDEAMHTLRGMTAACGVGSLESWDELSKKRLPGMRNYRDEDEYLDNDEYALRDPVDAWKNQRGVISFTIVNLMNVRLAGIFRNVPSLRIDWDNACRTKELAALVWNWEPVGPIMDSLDHKIAQAEANRVAEYLKDINEYMEGKPSAVVPKGTISPLTSVKFAVRMDIERELWKRRKRCFLYMRRRAREMTYRNRAKAFSFAVWAKWRDMGAGWRVGDDNWSHHWVTSMEHMAYVCNQIFSEFINHAGVVSLSGTNDTDEVKWVHDIVGKGRANLYYGSGKKPGDESLAQPNAVIKQERLWIAHGIANDAWLDGTKNDVGSNCRKTALLIQELDSKGKFINDWEVVRAVACSYVLGKKIGAITPDKVDAAFDAMSELDQERMMAILEIGATFRGGSLW